MSHLISCAADRMQRHEEKMRKLLLFLKEETYTNTDAVKALFGFKHHKSVYSLLNAAKRKEFVRCEKLTAHGVPLTLWGITMHGLAQVLDESDKVIPKEFQPWRVATSTLDHTFLHQRNRIQLENAGASAWRHGDRAAFIRSAKIKHRPDAVFTAPSGLTVAVETERRLKTPARYRGIMGSHLSAMARRGDTPPLWHMVLYITPEPALRSSLKIIFDSVQDVVVDKTPVKIEEKHRARFVFLTCKELETLDVMQMFKAR